MTRKIGEDEVPHVSPTDNPDGSDSTPRYAAFQDQATTAAAVAGTPRLPPIKVRRTDNDCLKVSSSNICSSNKKYSHSGLKLVANETRRELLEELDSYKTSRDGMTYIIPVADLRKRPHFLRPLTPRSDRRHKRLLDDEQLRQELHQQLLMMQQQQDDNERQHQLQYVEEKQLQQIRGHEQLIQQRMHQQQIQMELLQVQQKNQQLHDKEQVQQDVQQHQEQPHQQLDQNDEKQQLKSHPQTRERSASASAIRRRLHSPSIKTKDGRLRKRRAPRRHAKSVTLSVTPVSSLSSDGNMEMDRASATGHQPVPDTCSKL